MPSMTIKNLMDTECLDVDEILLSSESKKKKTKKRKEVRPMSELIKNMRGGN